MRTILCRTLYAVRSRPFFDHDVRFEIDFPIQNNADMKQAVLSDLEVSRKRVFVPPEKDTRSNGLDIHGGRFENPSVPGGIFDDFLVKHLVFAPAGYGVKSSERVGIGRYVEIASDKTSRVAILLAGIKILADQKLK